MFMYMMSMYHISASCDTCTTQVRRYPGFLVINIGRGRRKRREKKEQRNNWEEEKEKEKKNISS